MRYHKYLYSVTNAEALGGRQRPRVVPRAVPEAETARLLRAPART